MKVYNFEYSSYHINKKIKTKLTTKHVNKTNIMKAKIALIRIY